MKGNYIWPVVLNAQRIRFAWARECMKTAAGRAEFVRVMVDGIERCKRDRFRGHDAGDFFSPAYVNCWVEICRQLPAVRFWFPTRSWRPMLATYKGDPANELARKSAEKAKRDWTVALTTLASLPNVKVKPSALFFDTPAPRVPGLSAGSTAYHKNIGILPGLYACPAHSQGNVCLDCRVCWDTDLAVGYLAH